MCSTPPPVVWIAGCLIWICQLAGCLESGRRGSNPASPDRMSQSDVVDFRGAVTAAVVPDGPALPDHILSVAAWIRVAHHAEPQVIANRGGRGELFTLYLYKREVRMLVGTATTGVYAFATAPLPEIGAWTHYVGTCDGTTIRIYRDGELAGEANRFLPPVRGIPSKSAAPLYLGAESPATNGVLGELRDVRLFDRALAAAEVAELHGGGEPGRDALLGAWTTVGDGQWRDTSGHRRHARLDRIIPLRKADGYRGIWYANQPSGDEYAFKYAGGFATYPQQHLPIAIHRAAAGKTFFVYGAADADNRLQHAVSYFDHRTRRLARPTILLDKHTSDAHDNPVLCIDEAGYLWVFSAAHGRARPSFIHRSLQPYDIDGFDRVSAGNFSYPQPWFVAGRGFCFLHTLYDGRRSLYCRRSADGRKWSGRVLLASFGQGHYQVSAHRDGRVATVFNYHPQEIGLNARTNLYYMESSDGGATWRTARGERLALPLRDVDNPARIADYESTGLLVYLKDLRFDATGRPVILYLTSRGYEAGPKNDPRTWRIRCFDGDRWHDHPITTSDHNYDHGSLYVEAPDRWRLFAPTQPGPQRYNTGGEMAIWESTDRGATWRLDRAITQGSRFNHTYLRRPVDAHPDFYALWADGHGRKRSSSALYFADRDGVVTRMR